MQLLFCFRRSQQCAEWIESPTRGLLIILSVWVGVGGLDLVTEAAESYMGQRVEGAAEDLYVLTELRRKQTLPHEPRAEGRGGRGGGRVGGGGGGRQLWLERQFWKF